MKKIITSLLFIFFIIATSCKTATKEKDLKDNKETIIEEETKESISILKVVNAKSGLRFRKKPKGKVIDKFRFNTELTIVEKTGITETINDNGKEISGEWVGVKHNNEVVYVFDSFLTDPKKPEKPENVNPIDEAILQAYIIKPGQYHGDEIPDGMTTLNWWGIFNDDGVYTVKETPITISTVHDAVLDGENEKSGKKITANNAKNCYLLMNNISYLSERAIDTVLTKPIVIHPEKPYAFNYNNIDYKLSSTAKSYDALNLNVTYFNAEDYKLYLEKTANGTTTKQLLLFERAFDDQMIQILFISDIDGDTIPDLLIDSANHYNATSPTLYLSKEAKETEILKIVSLHTSVGS